MPDEVRPIMHWGCVGLRVEPHCIVGAIDRPPQRDANAVVRSSGWVRHLVRLELQ